MKQEKKTRMSLNRKTEVVLRLLRGESIDELCREYGMSAHDLSLWRDQFIESGKDGFRKSPEDKKLRDAQRVIGKQAMELEMYKKKMELIRQIKSR